MRGVGPGENPKEFLMGRVVQFRQKPTKLAGQGRPGGKAVNPPADALTIILAVAAAGLVVLRLWPVVRVLLRFRHPRLELVPHTSLRWRR
jgi:hypothetical protein